MKQLLLSFTAILLFTTCNLTHQLVKPHGFELHCTAQDQQNTRAYLTVLNNAKHQVETFFGKPFPYPFTVTIHPTRSALDSCWQQAWKMPDFHSECWMVASGT